MPRAYYVTDRVVISHALRAQRARRDAARRAKYARDPAYRRKILRESSATYRRKRTTILAQNVTAYWTSATIRARRRAAASASYRKAMLDPARRAERRRQQNVSTARQRLKRKLNTMNPAKSHALVKEWRQIVADRKAVDFRMAKWAHAVRAEFGSGTAGDEQFFKWLDTELGLSTAERVEALNLARSFKAVPDPKIWADQGAAQIRRIVDLPRREQVAVIEAAKVEGKKIGSVIRGREEAASARSGKRDEPTRKAPDIQLARNDKTIIAKFARGLSDQDLAELLAEAIADQIVASPATVLAAAKRYAAILRGRGKKAA